MPYELFILFNVLAFLFMVLGIYRGSLVWSLLATIFFAILAFSSAIVPYERILVEERYDNSTAVTTYVYEVHYLGDDHPWIMWLYWGLFMVNLLASLASGILMIRTIEEVEV